MNQFTPTGTTNYTYTHSQQGLSTTKAATPVDSLETTVNAAGQTVSEKKNGKTVNFSYYASGLLKSATPQGGIPLTMEYNTMGKRTKLTDPDAGEITSEYDAWGQLMWSQQKIHNSITATTTHYTYKPGGLLETKRCNGDTTSYAYDTKNRLQTVSIGNKHSQTFTYDKFDRVTNVTEKINNTEKIFNFGTEYDIFGRVSKETYPSGYSVVNTYDSYGYLTGIKEQSDAYNIWQAQESNALGQLTKIKKGGVTTTYSYNNKHQLTGISAPGIVNLAYDYNS